MARNGPIAAEFMDLNTYQLDNRFWGVGGTSETRYFLIVPRPCHVRARNPTIFECDRAAPRAIAVLEPELSASL